MSTYSENSAELTRIAWGNGHQPIDSRERGPVPSNSPVCYKCGACGSATGAGIAPGELANPCPDSGPFRCLPYATPGREML